MKTILDVSTSREGRSGTTTRAWANTGVFPGPRAREPFIVRHVRTHVIVVAVAMLAGCTSVDPGPNFVVPDETFDADYFFCHVEPEILFAKKCGPGDPGAGDPGNGCHFNSSAVSGMALQNHAPIDCANDRPVNRAQLGAGSAAQGNLQAASLVMSRDVDTAPIFLRPTGANHPRAVFQKDDPVVGILRTWARK